MVFVFVMGGNMFGSWVVSMDFLVFGGFIISKLCLFVVVIFSVLCVKC